MISLRRTFAIAYMNWIVLRRNWFRLFDVTLWPLILFYSITLFISFIGTDRNLLAMVIMGIIGWRAVYHFQIESSVSYMDNYWGRLLPHTLATPLKLSEFVIANLLMGLLKFIIVTIMYFVISYSMFSFSVPNWPIFLIAIAYLCFVGLVIGLITFGFTMLYHENAITFSFIVPDLLVLISGVYYPIKIFPVFIQEFVKILPTFYGFELLKSMVGYGKANYLMMFVTALVWLVIAVLFVRYCFRKAKREGKSGKFN
jgi:ABC-2 type transport system permease protein